MTTTSLNEYSLSKCSAGTVSRVVWAFWAASSLGGKVSSVWLSDGGEARTWVIENDSAISVLALLEKQKGVFHLNFQDSNKPSVEIDNDPDSIIDFLWERYPPVFAKAGYVPIVSGSMSEYILDVVFEMLLRPRSGIALVNDSEMSTFDHSTLPQLGGRETGKVVQVSDVETMGINRHGRTLAYAHSTGEITILNVDWDIVGEARLGLFQYADYVAHSIAITNAVAIFTLINAVTNQELMPMHLPLQAKD